MKEMSLYINIINLIVSIFMCYTAYKNNKLISFIYLIILQFLVIGQGIHISLELLNSNTDIVYYLYNAITTEGHFIASILLFMILFFIIFFERNITLKVFREKNEYIPSIDVNPINQSYLWIYYTVHIYIFLLCITLLINLVGGIDAWATVSRPGHTKGATVFILGMGMAMYPVIIKYSFGVKIIIIEKILFMVSFLGIMSFSRILACIHLFIFLFVDFYLKKRDLKEYKRMLSVVMGLIAFIMFIYGSYRHYLNNASNVTVIDFWVYLNENPEQSLLAIDLNYKISVEGMSGFSGALSSFLGNDIFLADLGISSIFIGLMHLFPYVIRNNFGDAEEYISSLYWYHGSIVPSGLECFFIHFSFFSVILYPLFFNFYTCYLHSKLASRKVFLNLSSCIIAGYGVMLIRGSLSALIFYTICELLILYISYQWFKIFWVRKNKKT